MSGHEPDLTGMTFHEIAAKYGREAAINAGIEADPEWGPEEMDMSGARPAAEVLPALVESYERSLRLRETDGAAPEEKPHDDAGAQASCAAPAGAAKDMDKGGMNADG